MIMMVVIVVVVLLQLQQQVQQAAMIANLIGQHTVLSAVIQLPMSLVLTVLHLKVLMDGIALVVIVH